MTEDKEILDAFRQEGKEDYAFNLLVRRYSPLLADPQNGIRP